MTKKKEVGIGFGRLSKQFAPKRLVRKKAKKGADIVYKKEIEEFDRNLDGFVEDYDETHTDSMDHLHQSVRVAIDEAKKNMSNKENFVFVGYMDQEEKELGYLGFYVK